MTIDELARQAGTSTRNVRALQTKGVVRGPGAVGRSAEYGEEHLTRLRAVLGLQARGFSLAAIRELLAAWEAGQTLEQVLGLSTRRGRRRPTATGFDDLVSSLAHWRGPQAGLLPEPLAREFAAHN